MKFKLLVATSFFIAALAMAQSKVITTPAGRSVSVEKDGQGGLSIQAPDAGRYVTRQPGNTEVSAAAVNSSGNTVYVQRQSGEGVTDVSVTTTNEDGADMKAGSKAIPEGAAVKRAAKAIIPIRIENQRLYNNSTITAPVSEGPPTSITIPDTKYESNRDQKGCNQFTGEGCMEKQAPSAGTIVLPKIGVTIDKTVNGNTAQQTISGPKGNEITATETRTSIPYSQTTTDATITNTKNGETTSAERVSTDIPVYQTQYVQSCIPGIECTETPVGTQWMGDIPQNTVTIQRNSNTIQAVGTGATWNSPEGTVTVTHQDGYTNTLTLD